MDLRDIALVTIIGFFLLNATNAFGQDNNDKTEAIIAPIISEMMRRGINQGRNQALPRDPSSAYNVWNAFRHYNPNDYSTYGPPITKGGAMRNGVNPGCKSGMVQGC